MSGCQSVIALKLDKKSTEALNTIQKRLEAGNALATVLSVGVFTTIFAKNTGVTAAFNITQTDWELYSQAMKGIPEIVRVAVQKDIDLMIIHYHMNYDYQHMLFWKGMRNGC